MYRHDMVFLSFVSVTMTPRCGVTAVLDKLPPEALRDKYLNAVLTTTSSELGSFFVLNVYSAPKERTDSFERLLKYAPKEAKERLNILGDCNAARPTWGYQTQNPKGRRLALTISQQGLSIQTDPTQPTRVGNSVSRDTCPDLTLVKDPLAPAQILPYHVPRQMPILWRTPEPLPFRMAMPQTCNPIAYTQPLTLRMGSHSFQLSLGRPAPTDRPGKTDRRSKWGPGLRAPPSES
ncbi:hypothetical protein HPB48_011295 [Haemaphysalis longicornis]|uniref:Endonuclease/exonuclease/phosphatase domain-containing protein n=1 Tax=Haemaphysalis longicornis TaxID=44386 RepID=A0A9J6GWA1_HAELO|nr:hypothetical protein HPB48_011295 [Haemaphysalis longicornis]